MDVHPEPVSRGAGVADINAGQVQLKDNEATAVAKPKVGDANGASDAIHSEKGTNGNSISVEDYVTIKQENPTVIPQAENGQEQPPAIIPNTSSDPPAPTQYAPATLALHPGPNPIGSLYEFAQRCKWDRPMYEEVETPGYIPNHHAAWGRFHATVSLPDQNLKAYAYANKKAAAKKQATENLIAKINGYVVDETGTNAPLYNPQENVSDETDGTEQASGKRSLEENDSVIEEKLPLEDALNPSPSLSHILKKAKWPQPNFTEAEDKTYRRFTITCCVGPADDPERFRSTGVASKARDAKRNALQAMFKELEGSPYFMGLWKIVSGLRSNGNTPAKRKKLEKAVEDYGRDNAAFLTTLKASDLGTVADVIVSSALDKQAPASTPYQTMEARLGLVLKHMKVFANTAASVLGGPSVEEANGWGDGGEKRRQIPCSVLLETVARNLPALSMTVVYDKDTKGEMSEEDVIGEPKIYEVGVEVQWCDEGTGFPRTHSFKGNGPSYLTAKDDAAVKFFLHFGLRDDEFEIWRVG